MVSQKFDEFRKIKLIGWATAWYVCYPFLFLIFWLLSFFGSSFGIVDNTFLAILFWIIFPLHCLTFLLQFELWAFYISHLVRNTTISSISRIGFGIGVLFLPFVIMPIYYYLYVRPDQTSEQRSFSVKTEHFSVDVAKRNRKSKIAVGALGMVILGILIGLISLNLGYDVPPFLVLGVIGGILGGVVGSEGKRGQEGASSGALWGWVFGILVGVIAVFIGVSYPNVRNISERLMLTTAFGMIAGLNGSIVGAIVGSKFWLYLRKSVQ